VVDFIAGDAIYRRDRNATALIWAVAFWAAGTGIDGIGMSSRTGNWDQCLSSRHALMLVESQWAPVAVGVYSRWTMFVGLPSHIDASQIAVFIARMLESVDT
jgi:hypothetical protein